MAVAEDHYDIIGQSSSSKQKMSGKGTDKHIGGTICLSFIALGGFSVVVYKPWRKYIEKKRHSRHALQGDEIRADVDIEDDPRARDPLASDQKEGPKLPKASEFTPDNNE